MSECVNVYNNGTVSCDPSTAVYFAVGVLIPFIIVMFIILSIIYVRQKNKRLRREQQQLNMGTVVAINNMMDEQGDPDIYSCPPHYTAITSHFYGKPPSYEQTLQQLHESNQRTTAGAAIIPDTSLSSSTTQLFQPSQT